MQTVSIWEFARDNLHKMSNPVYWENKMSAAENLPRMLSVEMEIYIQAPAGTQ